MKFLIAGLGNIGPEYAKTRHNIGFMVVQAMLDKFGASVKSDRHAHTSSVSNKGRQYILLMPTTYMNLSGKAVLYHLGHHSITVDRLLVITDDLSLPFGKMRMRAKGSDGGHNGLKHIQETLGTSNYPRLRVGIGNDFHPGQQVDYVLSAFNETEQNQLPEIIDKCINGILSFGSIGLERTMNDFNR
jgi:PTH1 family peptidyl-tRNA hydrolase